LISLSVITHLQTLKMSDHIAKRSAGDEWAIGTLSVEKGSLCLSLDSFQMIDSKNIQMKRIFHTCNIDNLQWKLKQVKPEIDTTVKRIYEGPKT
jgi:hypothetical protein